MGFLYDVLYLSEEKRNNSQLNNIACILNFSCSTYNMTFDMTQEKQKILQILVPIKLFYSVTLEKFTIKLESQLIANFYYHIQKFYPNQYTTYNLIGLG